PMTGTHTTTNPAYLVSVALDPDGRPTSVPPLIYETDEQRNRAQEAEARQAERKRRRSQETAN
ncbi:MAG: acyl-CoA thioesterase, partial [Anaerolineae bacterium]|nr:acyl-CoA thioesterase [Anaerolineae bacterium]